MRATISFYNEEVELELVFRRYQNGRLAVQAIDVDEQEPFGNLSVNFPEVDLANDEIIVKNYSENTEWAMQLVKKLPEVFQPTGKFVEDRYIKIPIYRILTPPDLS